MARLERLCASLDTSSWAAQSVGYSRFVGPAMAIPLGKAWFRGLSSGYGGRGGALWRMVKFNSQMFGFAPVLDTVTKLGRPII